MDLQEAQNAFVKMLADINKEDVANFFCWIQSCWLTSECLGEAPAVAFTKLKRIADDIRGMVPQCGILPSEQIQTPATGENADCDPHHTVHVDAFLYEEEHIDDLVAEGKMSRNYCKKCGSHEVAPLTFISHSMSIQRVGFIFQSLLPDLEGKVVFDVGSRLGPVLWGAYVYTRARKIIGVEMNEELCKIQKFIIEKYKMGDRIEVICRNICSVPQITEADVVVLNNVFEFFLPQDIQVKTWQFLRSSIKQGTILVTIPSLEDIFKQVKSEVDVKSWVKKRPITDPLVAMTAQDQEELSEVVTYDVL
ncbi:uncharacterized protein LOC106459240 [Limulus polyphemus]|uniref:Uncharacterized protein LOC106459240 n=1 Tax=Limulus polyphemus TaxID=6850 RepID=A0ABM1B3V7_LIMPO|nr:uncharacterized protein LOC106459240 [Limulus polyphemus]XP_022241395.1 uncharacterized protein LOC106459240 [Limulus polyphemus]